MVSLAIGTRYTYLDPPPNVLFLSPTVYNADKFKTEFGPSVTASKYTATANAYSNTTVNKQLVDNGNTSSSLGPKFINVSSTNKTYYSSDLPEIFVISYRSLVDTFDTISFSLSGGLNGDKFSIGHLVSNSDIFLNVSGVTSNKGLKTDLTKYLSNTNFHSNGVDIVTLSGSAYYAGTYLVIDGDHKAGFNPATDAVIKLVGLSSVDVAGISASHFQ